MEYLKAFLVGGLLCLIGQLLIDTTKLTPARILTAYVVAGVVLGGVGVYQYLVDFGGAGATVPLTGFGYSLAKGVREAAGPPVSTILVIRFATRITPSMNVLLLYQFLQRKARIASLCRANGSVGLQYISIFMGKAAFLATAFSVCCRT